MKEHSELVTDLFIRDGVIQGKRFEMLHAATGLAGEAGEVLDLAKKVCFTNKPMDRQKLIEEMSDVEFYMEALRQALAIPREFVLQMNIDKLRARHPEGDVLAHYQQEHDRNNPAQ